MEENKLNHIGIVDQPNANFESDSLNIKPHADALTNFIERCDTPITIGIQGEWGSGKTSLLNLIENNLDGNNFIPSVIKKGCKIIVTEKNFDEWKNGVLFINTKNIRKLLAQISFSIFKKKPNNLIAVTGTNGKSSVSDFYYQILRLNNKKVASIGTLGVRSNNFNLNLFNTTIDPIYLGKILNQLKKRKIENVIMEASSHGLHQNRLDGLLFNSAIFTNLSQDHLDYHKNFKNYLNGIIDSCI